MMSHSPSLADLRSSIERAADVEITVRRPCPGILDQWFAWANVDGDETFNRGASQTVGTAVGGSEYAVLRNLAIDLAPRSLGKLDALLAECAKPLPVAA